MQRSNERYLNNIIGQLNGVKKMIDEDQNCFEVLTQMKAARSALNSLMSKYMEDHFWPMINETNDKEEFCKKFMGEFVKTL